MRIVVLDEFLDSGIGIDVLADLLRSAFFGEKLRCCAALREVGCCDRSGEGCVVDG